MDFVHVSFCVVICLMIREGKKVQQTVVTVLVVATSDTYTHTHNLFLVTGIPANISLFPPPIFGGEFCYRGLQLKIAFSYSGPGADLLPSSSFCTILFSVQLDQLMFSLSILLYVQLDQLIRFSAQYYV